MTLNEWMVQTGTTQSVLARALRTTADSVRRWLDGGNVPSKKFLVRLAKVTAGNVTEADFSASAGPTVLSIDDVIKRSPPQQ